MTEESDARWNAIEENIKKMGNAITEKDAEITRLKEELRLSSAAFVMNNDVVFKQRDEIGQQNAQIKDMMMVIDHQKAEIIELKRENKQVFEWNSNQAGQIDSLHTQIAILETKVRREIKS